MIRPLHFKRRGIVEGFFGPPWSMRQRASMFEFGAAKGMNTYLYAPKDDPYHREKWQLPYPAERWNEMRRLIDHGRRFGIDFVYGFHPGKRLLFTADEPIRKLFDKAARFHDAGVRTFAVLFDDIPSRLTYKKDSKHFGASLARAEGHWLAKILSRQPPTWTDVEWWICPSYYTGDSFLARVFGRFERHFLERLSETLPQSVACMWTGAKVVSPVIRLDQARTTMNRVNRRLILWDNYPVNDLSMSDEMHLGPLTGRDPRLPEAVYGYLNNPLLQESLSYIPLATCFEYARNPAAYDPEQSWRRAVEARFGADALRDWRALRRFCERDARRKNKDIPLRVSGREASALRSALGYVRKHHRKGWALELKPWIQRLEKTLTAAKP